MENYKVMLRGLQYCSLYLRSDKMLDDLRTREFSKKKLDD